MISVIIPTYKQRGLLKNSIETVLNQTYQDFEIIVVDDNNPDSAERKSTEAIMEEYRFNEKIMYLQHEVNKNGSAARNTGFRASKGEYVAFLDDDDYWDKDKLEKQVNYLKAHQEFDSVYTFIKVNGIENPNKEMVGNIVVPYLMNEVSLQTSCLLFTRKAVEAINGFDESFRRHQDYEFLIKFFFAGFKIGCIPEYISYMNSVGGNRMSGQQLNDLKAKFLQTFDEQLNQLDHENPGIKKKIIVANYVKIFESHIARHNFGLAIELFFKYFFMSPTTFIKQCSMLLSNHNKRKKQKKNIK